MPSAIFPYCAQSLAIDYTVLLQAVDVAKLSIVQENGQINFVPPNDLSE